MSRLILEFHDVTIRYPAGVWAARNVTFQVSQGECLALVGESGCGKTTLARAALGLLPPGTRVTGSILIDGGIDVVSATEASLRKLRGRTVGFVAQDPFEACNPLDRVAAHVAEAWHAHGMRPPNGAVAAALSKMGIVDAELMMLRYPHQWSGGMLQRATIAAAAAHRPPLMIADEPTSALDAALADTIIEDLRKTGAAVLLISHDLSLVARHSDRVVVLYGGRIAEIAQADAILNRPRHPYTMALLRTAPRPGRGLPEALPGAPPDLSELTPGCPFAPRCAFAQTPCWTETPALANGVACPVMSPDGHEEGNRMVLRVAGRLAAGAHEPQAGSEMPARAAGYSEAGTVVEAREISRTYDRGTKAVHALVSASLRVAAGEIVGIAGPSGCGKSTLLRVLSAIEPPTTGQVYLGGLLASEGGSRRVLNAIAYSGFVMPIFQEPVSSLDRRWPIWRTITEPLMAAHWRSRPSQQQRREIAHSRLWQVGLANVDMDARPDELSVGQCQRVSIARALTAEPALIVADEPTSALDVSVSAAIVNLLVKTAATGTAIVIVSHDRALLDAICRRVLVMSSGVLEP